MNDVTLAAISLVVPIVGILCAPLIIWVATRVESQKKADIQLTLRTMIENGQTLSPEILDQLQSENKPSDKKEKDLRWGVIITALSLGIMLIGFLNGEGITQPGIGHIDIGAALLLLGLARLLLWKFAPSKEDEKQTE